MSEQQLQRVKVKRLAHVGLWTTDVVALARFYRQVLGLDLYKVAGNEQGVSVELEEANVFLGLSDDQHCLALFSDTRTTSTNGRKPVQRTQLHHLSFEVESDAELAALAARLNMSGIELSLQPRDGDPDLGDTLWFYDPDGNSVEIAATREEFSAHTTAVRQGRRGVLRPNMIQHVSLYTQRLEAMVDFYTEALGFDISDWLLRESAWLRCNNDHHTLMLMQGRPGIDHIGYSIGEGAELLRWADHLCRSHTNVLWGPGRHGAGNDLFMRFSDPEGIHIELSAELQQYYDSDVTTPPRLWHTRSMAFNLWGSLPAWMREEVRV